MKEYELVVYWQRTLLNVEQMSFIEPMEYDTGLRF